MFVQAGNIPGPRGTTAPMQRTAVLALLCAACVPADEIDGADPRSAIADGLELRPSIDALTEDEAWQELERLQREGVKRQLATLDPETRDAVMAELDRRSIDPGEPAVRFSSMGTPSRIGGMGLAVRATDLDLPAKTGPRALAAAFVRRFAPLWRVNPKTVEQAVVRRSEAGDGRIEITYAQHYDGLPVVGAQLSVHIDPSRMAVTGAVGALMPIDGLSTKPTVAEQDVFDLVQVEPDETADPPKLVVWSGFRAGRDPTPRLAWKVSVSRSGVAGRDVYIDAHDGDEIHIETLERHALQRSLFDMRGDPSFQLYSCQNWSAAASCGPHCAACVTDPSACALCTCAGPSDPADCADDIWRYVESDACTGDGSPTGEPNCDPEAQTLWDDAEAAYDYWATSFGRDSWDDAGNWLHLIPNLDASGAWFAGVALPRDLDSDGVYDTASVGILDGATNPFLNGHEFGHILQFGTRTNGGPSFRNQGIDAMEHNADVHGHRYQGLSLSAGYDCAGTDLRNYGQFRSFNAGQSNKFIGNCHGWLMHQAGSAVSHYGVSVTPQTPAVYDQIWFRALDDYFATSDDYFDWWNHIISAAFDLYGFGAEMFTALDARDAIGGWTDFQGVASAVGTKQRIAAVSWAGGTNVPCAFYRPSIASQTVLYTCRNGSGWTTYAPFNDTSIDPAVSEPAATFRYESGQIRIYVAWRGTDDRIHYRTLDPATMTIGAPQDLGPSHLTSGVPAIAPVFESGALDRLMVVYHPLAHPTWFFSTYVGSPSPAVDLGPSLDSDADPALTAYPYWDRVYFVRPDSMSSSTPGRLRYTSFTMTGGWEATTDLTALFETDTNIDPSAVTSDRAVSLAEYGRTSNRLRMTYIPPGGSELWFATLTETSPGVLGRDGYRPVPMATTAGASQSAGGLAAGPSGIPLYHFWGQGGAPVPKLYEWRMYGD